MHLAAGRLGWWCFRRHPWFFACLLLRLLRQLIHLDRAVGRIGIGGDPRPHLGVVDRADAGQDVIRFRLNMEMLGKEVVAQVRPGEVAALRR
jgi:hypothetical protein